MQPLTQNFVKMSNRFIPHTEEDIRVMLDRIGVQSVDDLYDDIPAEVIFKEDSNSVYAASICSASPN